MSLFSRTITIALLLTVSAAWIPAARAAGPVISAVTVEHVPSTLGEQSHIKVSFQTNELAMAWIDYGTSTAYGMFLGSSTYATQHEIPLTRLTSNTTYHFRITARNQRGEETMSFDQTFQSKKTVTSKDGTGTVPAITDVRLKHLGPTYAIFTWRTDAEAQGTVEYSTIENFSRPTRVSGSKRLTEHEVVVTRLKPSTRYYYRIVSKHEDGGQGIANVQTLVTPGQDQTSTEFQIERLSPVSWPDSSVGDTWLTVRWHTDEPSKGTVTIKALDRGVRGGKAAETTYETEHAVTLTNLNPNSRYDLTISASSVTGKRAVSGTVSLATSLAPRSPLLPQLASTGGTPRVAGASTSCYRADWTYGQCRNLNEERAKALELKNYLNRVYRNRVPAAALRNWYTLVNAYTYGGYPKEAIVKAVKWGGKTVHPTIPFSAWSKSKDYKDYISR